MEELERTFKELFEKAVQKVPEARTWNKVYQFNVEGQLFYMEIKGGALSIKQGSHPSPIATLSMSRDTLTKILKGELDAMRAFMSGQLKITGNVFDTVNLKKIIDAGLGK
ncbi:MAG: SCP2 sterol-binding domain-containing protein [Acidilobaceae archaeon]|nr:SCP2 sterol-binding domain-containing protein [Acidilobaceae archaeon]